MWRRRRRGAGRTASPRWRSPRCSALDCATAPTCWRAPVRCFAAPDADIMSARWCGSCPGSIRLGACRKNEQTGAGAAAGVLSTRFLLVPHRSLIPQSVPSPPLQRWKTCRKWWRPCRQPCQRCLGWRGGASNKWGEAAASTARRAAPTKQQHSISSSISSSSSSIQAQTAGDRGCRRRSRGAVQRSSLHRCATLRLARRLKAAAPPPAPPLLCITTPTSSSATPATAGTRTLSGAWRMNCWSGGGWCRRIRARTLRCRRVAAAGPAILIVCVCVRVHSCLGRATGHGCCIGCS